MVQCSPESIQMARLAFTHNNSTRGIDRHSSLLLLLLLMRCRCRNIACLGSHSMRGLVTLDRTMPNIPIAIPQSGIEPVWRDHHQASPSVCQKAHLTGCGSTV